MKRKKSIAIAISLLVSLGLLVFLFQGIDWQKLATELKRVQLSYLPLLLLLFFSYYLLKALRWRLLLPNDFKPKFWQLYHATLIGGLATNVLPLRAGEFIRPWALSSRSEIPFTTAFASVVTERVFDLVAVLFFFGLCLLNLNNVPPLVTVGAQALAGVACVLALVMLLSYFASDAMLRFARRAALALTGKKRAQLVVTIEQRFEEFIEGLRAISSAREFFSIIALSVLLWLIIAMHYQVVLWSMGEYPSLWVGMTINVMVALAVAAPSAPGFIGAFQFGCVVALSVTYAYSEEFALGFSVISHSFQFILAILVGMHSLRALGFGFRQIVQQAESNPA